MGTRSLSGPSDVVGMEAHAWWPFLGITGSQGTKRYKCCNFLRISALTGVVRAQVTSADPNSWNESIIKTAGKCEAADDSEHAEAKWLKLISLIS